MARIVQTLVGFDRRTARYRLLRVSCIEPCYPQIYLEDIMRRIMSHNCQKLHELLPDRWHAARQNQSHQPTV